MRGLWFMIEFLAMDPVDARALIDWQRFRTYNPHGVVSDE